MSHIDCFDHSHIGFMAGIMVYHPMQKDEEYGFDERSIIIGGGSGEHDIFVIQDMAQCLQQYVYQQTKEHADYSNVDYSSFWSIEECYHFFDAIKDEADLLNVSAVGYILISVGQFLAEHGAVFAAKGYLEQSLFDRAHELFEKSKLNIPDIMGNSEAMSLGRVIRDGKTVWGFSFEDECKEFLTGAAVRP